MSEAFTKDGVEWFLASIPKDSLGAAEIFEAVLKMKPGQKRTFKFDPRDPKLCSPGNVEKFHDEIYKATEAIIKTSYEVNLEKGEYLYTVSVVAQVWK